MRSLHDRMVDVITRAASKGVYPPSALAIMLEALDEAEKNESGLVAGIELCFCDRLRDNLLKLAGAPEMRI